MTKLTKSMMIIALTFVLAFSFTTVFEMEAMAEDEYHISVIVKATDSDFWQQMMTGAEVAEQVNENVTIDLLGPPSEADIAQQVAIVEDAVVGQPDAIVLASTSSDATVGAVEMAYEQGIKVVLVDNLIETDMYHTFMATDNIEGGAIAAEEFSRLAEEEYDIDLNEKVVGHINAMAGVQVLIDRSDGFIDRITELNPDVEMLDPRYVDNRIPDAMSAAEDIILAEGDNLGGFWANNNHTGVGVAQAIADADAGDQFPAISFDADPQQIDAIRDGYLDATIVQDPFAMGFDGVMNAIKAIEGEELPDFIDTGATLVTQDNLDDDEIQQLIDTDLRSEAILEEYGM